MKVTILEAFHRQEMFYEGDLEKIKEEYSKNPEKFTHGCYYTLAQVANKDCMKFLLEKEIPIKYPENFYQYVSEPLELDYLKWIHEEMKIPLNPGAYWGPATYGMFDMVKYLVDKKCPYNGEVICFMKEGHADAFDNDGNVISDHEKCWEYFKSNLLDKEEKD